jgi:Tol biopolymer transport system component
MRYDEHLSRSGPEAADARGARSRAGRPRCRRWTPGGIAWLLAAAIGLPWLPALNHRPEDPPMSRVRGDSGVPIRHVAFRPDGQSIAAIDHLGRVRIRPAVDGGGIERDLDVHGLATAMTFSPDGRRLAIGRDEPDVVLFDLNGGSPERLPGIPVRRTSDLRFSPDGRILAVSSYMSSAILLWDLEAGRLRRTLQGDSSAVRAMAFSPDGRTLATSSFTAVLLWDLATGRPRHRLAGPGIYIPSLAYSPDGSLLAAVDLGAKSVRIWDAGTGGQARMIPFRSLPTNSLAFSPDGRLLATADGDGFASLWVVATGRELRRLDGRAQYLWKVAFSPDGRTLAAVGDDDDIRLWDLNGPIAEPSDP